MWTNFQKKQVFAAPSPQAPYNWLPPLVMFVVPYINRFKRVYNVEIHVSREGKFVPHPSYMQS